MSSRGLGSLDPLNSQASSEMTSRMAKRKNSIPLPALTQTPINWGRVDQVSSKLCPCFPFITQLVLVSTTGSFSFGINTALLNTAATYIASDFKWCDYEGYTDCDRATWYKTLVSTAVFFGAALGALSAGRFMRNGPRLVTMISLVAYFVGVVGSVVTNGFSSLLFSRLIVGYGVGISSAATPVYISEMAPKERRGFYGSFHQVILSVGQLIAVLLGLAFSLLPEAPKDAIQPTMDQMDFDLPLFNRIWWRTMLGLGMVPVLIAVVFMGPIFTFETPQYYIRRRDVATATALLTRIHGKEDVASEVAELEEQGQLDMSGAEKVSFGQALKKEGYMNAFLTGIALSVFQQITGVNAYISASNRLFSDAGLSAQYVTYASLGFTCVAPPCNLICTALVERLGRRTLLTWGAVGATISVTPATILYWIEWNAEKNSDALVYSAIIGACLFMGFFSVSSGPVTWLYIFEIFPMEIKAKASSICVAFNWAGGILMVFCAGLLQSKVTFSIFFVCGVIYVIFTFVFIKETKGRAMGDSPFVPNRLPVQP
eukprot:Gregarina_sp_Poly_1__7678@NODE_431_length_8528_cov_89_048812_g349_i1_p2_GENE_NODE_431_length_8528_cov_89_048812_g349_i1NODE_431_length_8528_cov_89_048812_g349_i1_p2_ORF_typecomplete_len543_score40_50Sugar_tr/PF00083_24/3_2e91MFS_1/PF07690_16/3_1e19MFS_1/PF07690_16/2_2e12MFS_3/PF05977_13/2_2e06MFS_3/PF05977_13/0_89PUCC/PF03209_15/0_0013PUCC/PF03209_15/3_8e03MFS_4/PF06779_14/1_6DUF3874/PF12990_7/0_5OATP/PF03137_20/2_3e02OATP/PF03137_20/0_66_NODE_431_length_8528_cov_89_048812_g349_i141515779